ncbi:MAG: NfeD family protein [Oleibacter sp.]|nr:NfeD family protein [Thalassolituus sp.]
MLSLDTGLVIGGLSLLAIEILLLGMGTFFLFFIGVALLVSGGLMMIDLIPHTAAAAIWSTVLFTIIATVLLWRPLHRLQATVEPPSDSGDFANDLEFELKTNIDINGGDVYRYSGIDWKLKSKSPIVAGTRVKVVRKEVGVFWVEAVG